jgi:hypothetical protein
VTEVLNHARRRRRALLVRHGLRRLRGLGRGRYRLTDPFTEVSLGTVDAQHNTVKLTFEQFQIIVAEPIS